MTAPPPRYLVLAGAIVAPAAILVALSFRRPELPVFAPTPPAPAEVGPRLAGPITITVDATDPAAWRFFDFSRGAVIERPGPLDWDLAFRRFHIIANGGPGFAGRGGIRALEGAAFDSVRAAPADGYTPNRVRSDTTNPAITRWYDYGFTTHLLTPKPAVYLVRTADGRYAKIELLGYYCPGARPGCVTFRYVYQGDGSREF
ncbi:MAG TPA: HmuY family protein [Longimicrobiales bacterium]